MLGSGTTAAVRAIVVGSPARSRDADLYRRYAAGLYRQALLSRGDPALADHVACEVIVNECALARIPERGEDHARYRLTESVLRRRSSWPAERWLSIGVTWRLSCAR